MDSPRLAGRVGLKRGLVALHAPRKCAEREYAPTFGRHRGRNGTRFRREPSWRSFVQRCAKPCFWLDPGSRESTEVCR